MRYNQINGCTYNSPHRLYCNVYNFIYLTSVLGTIILCTLKTIIQD